MRDWLSNLLSEGQGEPSIRRLALAIAVLLVAALCIVGLWRPVPETIKDLALGLMGAAFVAVTAGRFAEGMDKRGE
jgi:hypothetical protein